MKYLVAALVMFVLWAVPAGCATASRAEDLTGGIEMHLLIESRADDSAAYYRVDRDGTIGYGGGLDARHQRVTWTGSMSDQAIERLRTLIDEHELLTRDLKADEPAEAEATHTIRLRLRAPAASTRARLRGPHPAVEPLRLHLREVTLQRFDDVLRQFPLPRE